MIGIYKIQNKQNGKVYIGKSKNIMQRWSIHEQMLEQNNHHSIKLQEDFNNSNGLQDFSFEILEICDSKDLTEKEKFYIKKFNSIEDGYNMFGSVENSKEEITLSYETFKEICQRLKPQHIPIYMHFLYNCDDDKNVICNQLELAGILGITPLTLNKTLKLLETEEVIKKIGKKGLNNIYKILL